MLSAINLMTLGTRPSNLVFILSGVSCVPESTAQCSHSLHHAQHHGGNDADEDAGRDAAEEENREVEEYPEVLDERGRHEELAHVVKHTGRHADTDR